MTTQAVPPRRPASSRPRRRCGTVSGYSGDCRCSGCRRAKARHDKARRLLRQRGWRGWVDPEPARRHVEALLAGGGLSVTRIADLAGLSRQTVVLLRQGRTPQVRAATAAAVLNVRPGPDPAAQAADGAPVDATGVRRRIQGLHAIGWRGADLAERLGVQESRAAKLATAARVRAGTARAVDLLYRELSMAPGPSAAARTHAARKGWMPPLAWDEETIDDPAAVPDRGVRPGHRAAALREDAQFLCDGGESAEHVAERLGITPGYLTDLLNGTKGCAGS